jgi:hypothetical protein
MAGLGGCAFDEVKELFDSWVTILQLAYVPLGMWVAEFSISPPRSGVLADRGHPVYQPNRRRR